MKLNKEQFEQYCQDCDDYQLIITDWRKGQLYFNVLQTFYPDLAEEIRGTDVDPFYDDRVLPSFFKYIQE